MAFACVYMHTQQVGSSSAKITGKEEVKTVFRLFWNNINQQMMDYQILIYNYIKVLMTHDYTQFQINFIFYVNSAEPDEIEIEAL